MMTPTNEARIVRVLAVVDTREYVEVADGVWKPIPGTGLTAHCARCGRPHEVHATVELGDGSSAIVGTGCMGAESTDVAARVKSATAAAKTLARLRAELAARRAELAAYERACAEVAALPVPAPVVGTATAADGRTFPTVRVGDGVEVWCQFSTAADPERVRCAVERWRENRIRERCAVRASVRADVAALEERVAKIERKLAALAGGV